MIPKEICQFANCTKSFSTKKILNSHQVYVHGIRESNQSAMEIVKTEVTSEASQVRDLNSEATMFIEPDSMNKKLIPDFISTNFKSEFALTKNLSSEATLFTELDSEEAGMTKKLTCPDSNFTKYNSEFALNNDLTSEAAIFKG